MVIITVEHMTIQHHQRTMLIMETPSHHYLHHHQVMDIMAVDPPVL